MKFLLTTLALTLSPLLANAAPNPNGINPRDDYGNPPPSYGCSATDTCARAVRGTSDDYGYGTPEQQRREDCSKVMVATTVVPKTVTVTGTIKKTTTITITKTTTIPPSHHPSTPTPTPPTYPEEPTPYAPPPPPPSPTDAYYDKRGAAAAGVPSYASACKNVGAYSSACSCWGVMPGTTTAPTPVVTKYSTVTLTATVTVTTTVVGGGGHDGGYDY